MNLTNENIKLIQLQHEVLSPYKPIAERIKLSLDNYANYGIPVGDFLQCVLTNDLVGALSRADHYNKSTMYQIIVYLYNDMPQASWGSRQAYDNWLKKFLLIDVNEQN